MDKDIDEVIKIIKEKSSLNNTEVVYISKDILLDCLKALKSDKNLLFTILVDLFAIDFIQQKQKFEVGYNLLSMSKNIRAILKIEISENESLPSVAKIFSSANWYEREVFDMFGIKFDDSSDLRRILTDYNFTGHPLRKDFPLTGYVQVRYDEKLKQVVEEPVTLQQEFRDFDFLSPWEGPEYVLPGDEKASKNKADDKKNQ